MVLRWCWGGVICIGGKNLAGSSPLPYSEWNISNSITTQNIQADMHILYFFSLHPHITSENEVNAALTQKENRLDFNCITVDMIKIYFMVYLMSYIQH